MRIGELAATRRSVDQGGALLRAARLVTPGRRPNGYRHSIAELNRVIASLTRPP